MYRLAYATGDEMSYDLDEWLSATTTAVIIMNCDDHMHCVP